MKDSLTQNALRASLKDSGSRVELWFASIGCLIGTILLVLAVQFFQDANVFLIENSGSKNYFTLNKKVEGGALANLGNDEQVFKEQELDDIQSIQGVKRIGSFTRNQFPLTLYIWPSGKIGFGAAAKTDLFFESIPDAFLDFIPEGWDWQEDSKFVPIMVPKFYLDLWNFGLAPSRIEYPALSTEAATGMPIELFIGKKRDHTLNGRFVAFSKRINSVLVPKAFLDWANQKFGQPGENDFFFLWKKGSIVGPPISRFDLSSLRNDPNFKNWEVSPLEDPAARIPATEGTVIPESNSGTSRIILQVEEDPSAELLRHIEEKGYELNVELPQQDLVKKTLGGLFLFVLAMGCLLSSLSIATFATSFRLVISRSRQKAEDLLMLGFSSAQISKIFVHRFVRLFIPTLLGSLLISYQIKSMLGDRARGMGIDIEDGFTYNTLILVFAYACLYVLANKWVIDKSIQSLSLWKGKVKNR